MLAEITCIYKTRNKINLLMQIADCNIQQVWSCIDTCPGIESGFPRVRFDGAGRSEWTGQESSLPLCCSKSDYQENSSSSEVPSKFTIRTLRQVVAGIVIFSALPDNE